MNILKLSFICIVIVFSGCSNENSKPFYPPEKSPEVIGGKIIDEYLSRGEFMLYLTDDCRSIHYAEVCAAFGAVRLAGLTGDTATIQKVFDRYRNVEEEGPENTKNHVDTRIGETSVMPAANR